MKLIESYMLGYEVVESGVARPMSGITPGRAEEWDIGDGYQLDLLIDESVCQICVEVAGKDITCEVASVLGLDVSKDTVGWGDKANRRELYLSPEIDGRSICYTKVDCYMELLAKIEAIVNEQFKNK